MAFTAESRAKAAATQAANRERKAAGLPPIDTPKKKAAGKRRAASPRKSSPTITLSPPDVTASAGPAPQTLGDPGESPAKALHQTLLIVFGPINYLLERAGGFDLTEEEFNLIFLPLERIMVRRGLGAAGQIPPDLFDGLQAAIGVLTYGVRVAPKIAERRSSAGSGGGGRAGAGGGSGQPGGGGNQAPGTPPGSGVGGAPWATITPESIFADVGYAAPVHAANGHVPYGGPYPGVPSASGSSGE